jgi:acetylornithine/succinyldiaminopimelate/putrescine aminotransferase
MMDLTEAVREGVDWQAYDVVALGAPVLYGTYHATVFDFIKAHQDKLEAKPSGFFNVSVVARTPEKSTVEGNRYIDFAAGIAVVNTGHCHPKVMGAVAEQMGRFTHTCHQVMPYENYIRLAERLNMRLLIVLEALHETLEHDRRRGPGDGQMALGV